MKSTITLLLLSTGVIWAQNEAFEVASVKEGALRRGMSGAPVVMRGCNKPDPALVRCTGVSLRELLARAYDMKWYQIQGPDWLASGSYDVMAKVPAGVPADRIPAMLQALIAERFGVKLHKETRALPVYELTIAKGGPKLQEVDVSKLPALPEPGSVIPPGKGGGPGPVNTLPVGTTMMMFNSNGARTIKGNLTVEQLANSLGSMDRPALDRTGLTGTYQIELTYMGDDSDGLGLGAVGGGPTAGGARPQDVAAPVATLAQALQQTLGLKLESKKAPLDMIVVDSANRTPTEN